MKEGKRQTNLFLLTSLINNEKYKLNIRHLPYYRKMSIGGTECLFSGWYRYGSTPSVYAHCLQLATECNVGRRE